MSNVQPIIGPSIDFSFRGKAYTFYLPDHTIVSENIRALFHRKKGSLFHVNDQGLLETVTWRNWLSYKWNEKGKNGELAKVKSVIEETLKALDAHCSNYRDEKVARYVIKTLFNKWSDRGIGRLGQALYNQNLTHGDNHLSQLLISQKKIRVKIGADHFIDFDDPEPSFSRNEARFVEIDLGDKISNHNLWKLLTRKKGEKFQTGIKQFNQEKIAQDVKIITTKTINELERWLLQQSQQESITKTTEVVIRKIFFPGSPLSRMSPRVFDRWVIKECSVLEKIIHGGIEEKKEALFRVCQGLRDGGSCGEDLEKVNEDLCFEEGKFHQKLGVDLEKNKDGGSGGARYMRNRFGRRILVVKPGDEGPYGANNPQWYARLKQWVISARACLLGNSEPLTEYESFLCDRAFRFYLVPPTQVRNVVSNDFVGEPIKECSVQAFVDGCHTLEEHIELPHGFHLLPRPFLRWYLGGQQDLGPFKIFSEQKESAKELFAKLPLELLDLIKELAIHNFLIEDTDCHFENILIKTMPVPAKESIIARLFKGDQTVQDEEIRHFVRHFFSENGNQMILQELLSYREVKLKGQKTRVYLIKHDGGASNPHSHPHQLDFLSLRFKHLFEVLPHFESPFGSVRINEENFNEFLREKGRLELKNILGTTCSGKSIFDTFWEKQEEDLKTKKVIFPNRKLFYKFIFNPCDRKSDDYIELRGKLAQCCELTDFAANRNASYEMERDLGFYFDDHLERIHGTIQTRRDSFKALSNHIQSGRPMRELFNEVRSEADFERVLKNPKNEAH